MRTNGGGKGHAPAMVKRADMIADWEVASASDRGRVRRRNEDAILVRPASRVYAVADGMGGHAAGNVASALAVQTLDAAFPRAPSPRIGARSMGKRMRDAFAEANVAIIRRADARPAEAGMGTTLTAVATLRAGPCCVIAHVGDSRAYRYRTTDGLTQLTHDHTWVQAQVDAGALTLEEARVHPYSSILTRVLGMDQPGAADLITVSASPDDILLLCSDGLTGMVSDELIAETLTTAGSLDVACTQLISLANEAGGRDNISLILLRCR